MKGIFCAPVIMSLLGLVLAGCRSRTSGPVMSTADTSAGATETPAAVASTDLDKGTATGTRGGPLVLEGQPISNRVATIEEEDARLGAEIDRAGLNPRRIRDIEIKNLSRDGNIWIGGEPTYKGYQQVYERGVTAIVDLRNPTPVQKRSAEEARRLGVDYVNIPIDPKNMDPPKATAFLDFMRQHQGEQVLIHCGSANRASGMYAVFLGAVQGLSADEAIERARRTGLRERELEEDVRRYLEDRAAPDRQDE